MVKCNKIILINKSTSLEKYRFVNEFDFLFAFMFIC